MKIKRVFAADMRQAIRQVRETLGSDAVILSNKSVDGGVELVAAMDYDEAAFNVPNNDVEKSSANKGGDSIASDSGKPEERVVPNPVVEKKPKPSSKRSRGESRVEWSQDPVLVEMSREMQALRRMMENELSALTWRDMGEHRPQLQELLRRLMSLDISPDICRDLVSGLDDFEQVDQGWRKALHQLATTVPTAGDHLLEQGGVMALVGPTGVGKTTSIAKLAARFALKHGHRHLALVSTDSYRIGAREQLNTYARILDVPMRTAANAEELHVALNALSDKRLILVDTAGMSPRDVRISEQLSMLRAGNKRVRTLLTLSATTQQASLGQTIELFSAARPDACILTKVDEAVSLGGALSAIIQSRLPLAYVTDGQKVPEDLHLARAHTLVSRAAELGQREGETQSEGYLALALGGTRAQAHG
jgi:flagellar biosynthesis protein FlhF